VANLLKCWGVPVLGQMIVVACKTYAMGFINIKSGTSRLMSKTIAKLILNVPNDVSYKLPKPKLHKTKSMRPSFSNLHNLSHFFV
jgi:hypothetical protein